LQAEAALFTRTANSLLPNTREIELQSRERRGGCWGRDQEGRSQGECLERKLKAMPQGEEGQEMVVKGRRERALRHRHTGGAGGQGELEIVEDKLSSREVTDK